LDGFIKENSKEVGDQRESYLELQKLNKTDLAYLVSQIVEGYRVAQKNEYR